MDKQDYLKIDRISNSELGWFKRSPLHYKHYKDNPPKDTKATLTGSAFHYLVFEPGNFSKYMMVINEHERPEPNKDYRNAENKKWKDQIVLSAQTKGLELISSDEFGVAQDMYDAVMSDPRASELLKAKGNKFEKTDFWEWDGLQFKRKADIWNPDFIADLKSTQTADPRGFARKIFEWDYHRQGGMYSDGDRQIEGSEFFKDFYLIAVESEAPYGVSVHMLTEEVLQYGCDEYRTLARELNECKIKNEWPGYSFRGQINNIFLPKYLKNDD
jgi:hypothetical protein